MTYRYYIPFLTLIVLFLLLSTEVVNAQCVMCGASIESSEDGESIIKGVKKGIAYLMLFPYVLIGSIAYFWYRNYKKTKNK